MDLRDLFLIKILLLSSLAKGINNSLYIIYEKETSKFIGINVRNCSSSFYIDIEFATKFRTENGGITPALQADLDKINGAGIPRDIRFIQGDDILFGSAE